MTILQQTCPRCAIQRTVRLGHWGAVCFNCRLTWKGTPTEARAEIPYAFSEAELSRLEMFRVAIRVGLYSDYPSERRAA
jgi:hypothetical protein